IMFFDRLGEKQDEPLIASLASRLLKSQNTVGGWSYSCTVDPADVQRLTAVLRGQKELPKPPGKEETPVPMPTQRPPFPGITQRPPQPGAPPVPIRPQIGGGPNMEGDNSNTQFATLALWIARRHQLKVDAALKWVDQRFRAMQNPDGGWPYVHHGNTTPTMTCAGLIGLAVAFGATNEAVPQNDPDHPREPKESKSTKSAKSKQP